MDGLRREEGPSRKVLKESGRWRGSGPCAGPARSGAAAQPATAAPQPRAVTRRCRVKTPRGGPRKQTRTSTVTISAATVGRTRPGSARLREAAGHGSVTEPFPGHGLGLHRACGSAARGGLSRGGTPPPAAQTPPLSAPPAPQAPPPCLSRWPPVVRVASGTKASPALAPSSRVPPRLLRRKGLSVQTRAAPRINAAAGLD